MKITVLEDGTWSAAPAVVIEVESLDAVEALDLTAEYAARIAA
jgi:uncharacterized protein (DUF1330 family)